MVLRDEHGVVTQIDLTHVPMLVGNLTTYAVCGSKIKTLAIDLGVNPRIRCSSHYAAQAERSLPKFLLRGEGRSSLKYIMSDFLSNFEYFNEKMFGLSTRVWVFILSEPKLLPRGRILGAKSAKKCYHVGTLEASHLWSLATSVKVERSTS